LLFAPIASLPLLARGLAIASQHRLALGANSRATPLSFTIDFPVTGHSKPATSRFELCQNGAKLDDPGQPLK
jgi:hypothetical protein